MQSKIYRFFLIFLFLLLLFQYTNSKNILDSYELGLEQCKESKKMLEDEILVIKTELDSLKRTCSEIKK